MWVIWNGVTVAWELEWYDKQTEVLVGQSFLPDIGEEDMRSVLLVDDQSLCGGLYPLDSAAASRLRGLTDAEIDLANFHYFVGVADVGLTKADKTIKASDFPEHEVLFPAPRNLSSAFGEVTAVMPKTKI